MSLSAGQRVDRYVLVEALGEGGMGTVWLAHPHDAPEQLVAVKMVLAEYTSDPRVCSMFVKEASLAASINHPNVVRLFDVGLHEDTPFFVMEWVDGFSLRDIAGVIADSGERVPPAIALRIASDLCAGLHAAHELRGDDGALLGLVHRDVSPHNVLVTRRGIAKLIDFGVAKARDVATGSDQSVCGGVKGKVRYMAPEQALEKSIDRRADLFSVGAITYQLLTGRAPFEASTELAIINQLLSNSPVFVPEDLPEPVQWILRRALARRPENRFDDAREMREAIDVALAELAQPCGHREVADCLAWFEAFERDRSLARPSAATSAARVDVRNPVSSRPPPLAFATPKSSPTTSLLADDPSFEMARRQRAARANASSWRFVAFGALFVAALGIFAVILRERPARTPTRDSTAAMAATESSSPPPLPPSTILPRPAAPIIDIGDLDERRATKARPKRTPSPPASTSAAVRTAPSASVKVDALADRAHR